MITTNVGYIAVGGLLSAASQRAMESRFGPLLAAVVADLNARGERVTTARVLQLEDALETVAAALVRSERMARVMHEATGRLVLPMLNEAVPALLDRLAVDPEPLQAVLRVQSTGVVNDLTAAVRDRSATADERAASVVERVRRRRRPKTQAVPTQPSPMPLA